MELADYSVLKKEIFEDVYEPSEDTFILVDALAKDFSLIKQLKPTICLEIGSGSGAVISSIGKSLKNPYYLTTDLNPIAAQATKATTKSNGLQVDTVITNMVDGLHRLYNSVDLLICNPPYGVTHSEEVGSSNNILKATSGGIKGREVMDKVLHLVPKLLSKQGLFYLTCIVQNDVDDISQVMETFNLQMAQVLCRNNKATGKGKEHLFVLRFSFKN